MKKSRTEVFEANAPTDPRVSVAIIQGQALLANLSSVADHFAKDGDEDFQNIDLLGSAVDIGAYFAGDPLPIEDPGGDYLLDAGHQLLVAVEVPESDSLRAAFAIALTDIEDGRSYVSEPLFLTSVRGEVISTDLPVGLLDEESVRILGVLDQAGDIDSAAQSEGDSVEETWGRIVNATQQLGAGNVDEAVALVATTHLHPAGAEVMVGA
jgi:hypothetical protein